MSIIISPQAGMCNRFRAIASVVTFARFFNKDVYHYWVPSYPNSAYPYIRELQKISLEDIFEKSVSRCPENIVPDICFSEWINGHYWYKFQSSAQRHFNINNIVKLDNDFDPIIEFMNKNPDKNILIETSIDLKFKNIDSIEWNRLVKETYKSFIPKQKYLDLLKDLPQVKYGISIRRGEFIDFYPKANQSFDDIYNWLSKINEFLLLSYDEKFKFELKDKLERDGKIIYTFDKKNLKIWEQGFVEFLYLAYKCDKIYGTPMSSYSIEAAKYGDKPYGEILESFE
jgi:hypothetical protein